MIWVICTTNMVRDIITEMGNGLHKQLSVAISRFNDNQVMKPEMSITSHKFIV